MAYLIGTDEAGYGPNLGPLLITATVWEVPPGVDHENLYRHLKEAISPQPEEASDRVWMADSKQMYRAGGGLAALELGVLAAAAASGQTFIDRWSGMWDAFVQIDDFELKMLPWYVDFDEDLPVDTTAGEVDRASIRLMEGLAAAGVKLCRVQSRALFPRMFNESLREYDNKSTILSHETIGLICGLLLSLEGPVSVLCDKHGGRNKYAALLQHHLGDGFVQVRRESREESRYDWHHDDRHVDFRFRAKADNILPAALASMTSKYLRELAMRAFNRFWCAHKSDLKPTAGYPTDARRFKKQIATLQAGLGISDQVLWRKK